MPLGTRLILVGSICMAAIVLSRPVHAQLGALLSPGELSTAHAGLEGVGNCQKCHEPGQRVTASRCLSCHKPIADRIAAKKGIHRDVRGDCVTCHVEHNGRNAELRPFEVRAFDHGGKAGYPLAGKHQALAAQCQSCHKTRSYLGVKTECQSCHADKHKGTLGTACATCHSVDVPFAGAKTSFDHGRTSFPLSGAHTKVLCERCHEGGNYKRAGTTTCSTCHTDPHRPAQGAACATCHTSTTWVTRRVDHARTTYPLAGKHTAVECSKCHKQSPMRQQLQASTCATCHADVHRGAFRQDCKACHSEQGFAKAPFDHTSTRFPLTGQHASQTCAACHKTTRPVAARAGGPAASGPVDFKGLQTACISCHTDVHSGSLGTSCENCHASTGFAVPSYTHATRAEFFVVRHAAATCESCHVRPAGWVSSKTTTLPVTFKGLKTDCVSCHRDTHLGQVSLQCETCHAIAQPAFTPTSFTHQRSSFALTGAHTKVECAKCHKKETGLFPAGSGTTVRFKPIVNSCATCHRDPHLGQLDATCESCHDVEHFKVTAYTHRSTALRGFFVGRHRSAVCLDCHKATTGTFPSGQGTAVRYRMSADCTTCHTDVHNGALGTDCIRCHRP